MGGGNASESLQDTKRPKMQSACKRQDHSTVRLDLALGQRQKNKKMTRVSVSTKAAVAFYFIFLTPESLSHPSTGLVFARFNGPDSKKKQKNGVIILICQLCTQTQIFPFSNMTAARTCLHASRSFQPRRTIQGKTRQQNIRGPAPTARQLARNPRGHKLDQLSSSCHEGADKIGSIGVTAKDAAVFCFFLLPLSGRSAALMCRPQSRESLPDCQEGCVSQLCPIRNTKCAARLLGGGALGCRRLCVEHSAWRARRHHATVFVAKTKPDRATALLILTRRSGCARTCSCKQSVHIQLAPHAHTHTRTLSLCCFGELL